MKRPLLLALGALAPLLAPVLLVRGQTAKEHPHGDLQTDCGECHSPDRWTPLAGDRKFRHETTGYVLALAHARASCRSCHRSLEFERVGTACVDCHQDVHRSEFGTACESCHAQSTWTNQSEMFRVHDRTRFPLFAVHARLDCTSCHRSQRPAQFASTPAECGNCHLQTFLATTAPSHVQAGFSRRCEDCHSVTATSWHEARFSHPDTFPLQGRHGGLACARCHAGTVYTGLSRACASCHQKDFAAAANPNHVAGNFRTTCEDCHTIGGWRPAKFDHGTTAFPLVGAHAQVTCERCHPGGRYAGTSKQCVSCHQANYDRTTNPNHRAGNIPTTCESCHSTGAWRPANFDHARTGFPLTGAHNRTSCERCHPGGRYAGTSRQCASCHQSDYDQTTSPNHRTANFPAACETCHGTNAWRPATFDHNRTAFPLTGAHNRTGCDRCHTGGRYAGTPKQCAGCHQAKYDQTTNPNHRAANFPTSCQDCHGTNAWRPATFDHDGREFPIYSGKHRGKWSACRDCHVNPSNYRVFECILCHEHSNRREVDDEHKDERGYAYLSTACYNCHPRGTKP